MASMMAVSCPHCQKEIKVPADLQGKKIRCKGCGQAFPIPSPVKEAESAKPASAFSLEDDGPATYGTSKEAKSAPRCPQCTTELDSEDAVICVSCGYNLRTRQRLETKKVIATSQTDHFSWILPGIIAVVGIFALIGIDLFFCLILPGLTENTSFSWLSYGAFRLWFVIGSLFIMFFAGKFAVQRLILNPTPPEKES